MNSYIHILAGSKGGIGKTRCSVALAMYYILGQGKANSGDLFLYDANFNNPDFYALLCKTMKHPHSNPLSKKSNPFSKIEMNGFLNKEDKELVANKQLVLFKRKNPFLIFNGINEFWKSAMNEIYFTENHRIGPFTLIVDTCLGVQNLFSFKDNKSREGFVKSLKELRDRWVMDDSSKNSQLNVYIWFVWSLNDFLDAKMPDSSDIEEKLSRLKSDVGDLAPNLNFEFIHVINPYLFYDFTTSNLQQFLNLLRFNIGSSKMDNDRIYGNYEFQNLRGKINKILKNINYESKNIVVPDVIKKALDSLNENLAKEKYSALVLDHDSNNIYYLRDKLIQPISELETGESTFAKLHHNKFGENSLWPKLDYIHGLK